MDIKAGSRGAGMCLGSTLGALMVGVAVKIRDAFVEELGRLYFVALINLIERLGFCTSFLMISAGFFCKCCMTYLADSCTLLHFKMKIE